MGYAADRANQIGRRTEQRFPSRIAAVISSGDEQVFGIVEDISSSGAKIETEYLARLGQRVAIRGVCLDSAGTIVWRRGKKCGVRFDEDINPLEVVRRNALLHKTSMVPVPAAIGDDLGGLA